jgi:S1-C subfamily serine protease
VIEPASSGGPLMGADGSVIGMTSSVEGTAGFAVPANTARTVLDQIERGVRVVRPYIGLRGTPTRGGVRVTDVHSDGPADRAGIRVGDVIEAIDDRPAATFGGLLAEVDRHEPGDTVKLRVERNGGRGDVTVELSERPATLSSG